MSTATKRRTTHDLKSLAHVYLTRFGGRPRPDIVEDTLQEAWKLAATRGVPLVDDFGGMSPWTVPLVMNAAGTVIRGGHRRAAPRFSASEGQVADPAAEAARGEIREIVARALREMDPADRALLTDHHMNELPIDEIAGSFGLSDGTVKSRLFRARNRLRSRLAAAGLTPEAL
jgi:RNA polymerase sigma-70 factor (ECF subfamily)